MPFDFVTAAPGTSQGAPPVKPKRKKPGTAVKRKVQPIAVDAKGNHTNWLGDRSSPGTVTVYVSSSGSVVLDVGSGTL